MTMSVDTRELSMRSIRRAALLAALALLVAACGGGEDETVRDANGNVIEGGDIGVFALNVGDCFFDLPAGDVSSITATPCAEDHGYEIYHLFDLDLPDFESTAVETEGGEGCFDAFEGYMGVSYADSFYDFTFLQPTSMSWDQGDREIVCFASPYAGGNTKGTAKDAGLLLEDASGAPDAQALADATTTVPVEPVADESTTSEAAAPQSVFDLNVGECYVALPTSDLIESVEPVSCNEPHGIEIYHAFDIDLPAFDSEAVSLLSQEGCYDAFEGYMGVSYEDSWYGFDGLLPTGRSWVQGDREIVCFVMPYDEGVSQSVGTARGQARTLGN